jgi:hypothetical protein
MGYLSQLVNFSPTLSFAASPALVVSSDVTAVCPVGSIQGMPQQPLWITTNAAPRNELLSANRGVSDIGGHADWNVELYELIGGA